MKHSSALHKIMGCCCRSKAEVPPCGTFQRTSTLINAQEWPKKLAPQGRLQRATQTFFSISVSSNQKPSYVMTDPNFQNRVAASVQTKAFPKGRLFTLEVQ